MLEILVEEKTAFYEDAQDQGFYYEELYQCLLLHHHVFSLFLQK